MGNRDRQLLAQLECDESLDNIMFALHCAIELAEEYIRRADPKLLLEGEEVFKQLNSPLEFVTEYLNLLGDESTSVLELQPQVERASNKKECPEMFTFVLQYLALEIEKATEDHAELQPLDEHGNPTIVKFNSSHFVLKEELLMNLKNNQAFSGYRILFLPSHARKLKSFLTGLKEGSPEVEEQELSQKKQSVSSITPKRKYNKQPKVSKKAATVTSITPVRITNRDANVNLFDQSSSSSDVDLETILSSVPLKVSTGSIGSSIFCKSQDCSYSFRSAEFPLGRKFIDLKIYDNPQSMREEKPQDQWKTANFRAKLLVGRADSNRKITEEILTLLKRLQTLMISDMKTYPGLVSFQEELSKRK